MNDVFISYARPDAPVALEIAELLRQQGQSVFLDADTLVAGGDLKTSVERAVRDAKIVFVVLSENTRRSRWVEEELTYALKQGKKKQIIPILLDDSAKNNWVWPLVADRQAISLSRDSSTNQVSALLSAITAQSFREEAGEVTLWKRRSQQAKRAAVAGFAVALAILLAVLVPTIINSTESGQRRLLLRDAAALATQPHIDDLAKTEWALAQMRAGDQRQADAVVATIQYRPQKIVALLRAATQWLALGNRGKASATLEQAESEVNAVQYILASEHPKTLIDIAAVWLTADNTETARADLARAQDAMKAVSLSSVDRIISTGRILSLLRLIDRSKPDPGALSPVTAREKLAAIVEWAKIDPEVAIGMSDKVFGDEPKKSIARSAAAAGWVLQGNTQQAIRIMDGITGDATKKSSVTALARSIVGAAFVLNGMREEGISEIERGVTEAKQRAAEARQPVSTAFLADLLVVAQFPERAIEVASEVVDKERKDAITTAAAIAAARQDKLRLAVDALSKTSDANLRTKIFVELAAGSVRGGSWRDARKYALEIADDSRRLEAYSRVLSSWKAQGDSRLEALDKATDKNERTEKFWEIVGTILNSPLTSPQ